MGNTAEHGLRDMLSAARLAEYEARCAGDLEAALRLHCWNTELSGAMYEVLQFVEVALRNSVHGNLTGSFGRADWWAARQFPLHHPAHDMVGGVIDKLDRMKPEWTCDDVVARPPLGFWVALFGRSYEHTLWYRGLRAVVPGYRGRRRDPLHRELDLLRTLRNRIAHHQPIYHRHLAADHESALRVLGYLGGGLETMVAKHSRVPGLLARGPR